jgi:hypothetical protein
MKVWTDKVDEACAVFGRCAVNSWRVAFSNKATLTAFL